jgi:hypothetical protein
MLLKNLSYAVAFITLLGTCLVFYFGDANRKIALSITGVGLIDEEPKDSLRRIAERTNQWWERAGFGLLVFAIVLQLVCITTAPL